MANREVNQFELYYLVILYKFVKHFKAKHNGNNKTTKNLTINS